jgi:hypothetical protein
MLRRFRLLIVTALVAACSLATIAGAHPAMLGLAAATKVSSKHKATKKVHGLSAPTLQTLANGAHVQQIPTLTWSAVSGAAEYEYQVAADPQFHSIVLGTGTGNGTAPTTNLAAALAKPVTDGRYYWRARGLTASKEPGPWSATRSLTKAWTQAPQLLDPANEAPITWPTVPLVLQWTTVPSAREYIVTIATDEQLSNNVVGTATTPRKTWGSVYALPASLPAGRYYWAITPVDALGHRGARSAIRSFVWSWPTATSTQLRNLAGAVGFEPEFKWQPIAGAARYEVEVNQSPEFPAGSTWCCSDPIIGTSFAPRELLANDHSFYWRVRAVDAHGNAGRWNAGVGEDGVPGDGFTLAFDSVTPSIPRLTMTGVGGEPLPDPTTSVPIVTWSPVQGAASYEVQLAPWLEHAGCNWAEYIPYQTSSPAWTPLSSRSTHIGPSAWPSPDSGFQTLPEGGFPYCVRVLARSAEDAKTGQVVSVWTQLGSSTQPAFRFETQPPPGSPGPGGLETPASAYRTPMTSTEGALPMEPRPLEPCSSAIAPCRNTPLLTWERVPGASRYYVVIARDANFTDVVDVASTVIPAYAPQLSGGQIPLNDQTNAYYWAVIPVTAGGAVFNEPPFEDSPQSFNKQSLPPNALQGGPVNGVDVESQPTFSWSPTEGALDYTLQVSVNDTFAQEDLLEEVKTDSTSFTTPTTYPANTTLFWRVRANDANSHPGLAGLNWSAVQTFKRTLPTPSPRPSVTPDEAIPVLSWAPVEGAVGYEIHVEQPDGTSADFTQDSPAFTPTEWDGPGIWRWSVRAEFRSGLFQTVPGGFSASQPLAHTLGPPPGAAGEKSGARIVINWQPEPYAREYEVQLSTTNTFATTIESHRTEQAGWAPDVDMRKKENQGTLYWRVAAVDNRGNFGPYAAGSFVPPKPKAKCVKKKVKRGHKTVKVCVKKTVKKH